MIAFLRSPAGRWVFRGLGLAVGSIVLTQGFSMAWAGDGHLFLLAIFLSCLAAFAYGADAILALALSFVPVESGTRPVFKGAIPPLSQAKQAQVRRLHKAMAQAGVFAPEVPDPELAFAAFAVGGQPVDWVGVLQSLAEAPYYHPQLDEAGWLASWNANLYYDHVPAAWLTPPAGKFAAVLWEDEAIFLSLIEADSMAALAKPAGRSAGWAELTGEVLRPLADGGVPVRQLAN